MSPSTLLLLQAQPLQQHRSCSFPLLCVHVLANAQHCATNIVLPALPKHFLTVLRSLGAEVAPKSILLMLELGTENFFSFPPLLLHCDNFPCTTKQTSDFPKLVPTPVLSCGQRHLSVLSQNCQHTKGPAVATAAEIPGAHPPLSLQGRANSFLIKLCL